MGLNTGNTIVQADFQQVATGAANIVPKTLSNGKIDNSFLYDLPIIRVYTSSGANTWTKPAGLKYIIVEVIGGGGGSGGIAASGATGGGIGGSSTFGTSPYLTAVGGSGSGAGNQAASGGASGGTASGGDLNVTGNTGSNCSQYPNGSWPNFTAGIGAGSVLASYGKGANGVSSGGSSTSGGSGGGGSGGYSKKIIPAATLGSTETATVGAGGIAGTGSTSAGIAGNIGVIIVTEYY